MVELKYAMEMFGLEYAGTLGTSRTMQLSKLFAHH